MRSHPCAPPSRRSMLDQTIRATILALREAGRGTRSIARALDISRGAVRAVLAAGKAEAFRDEILALHASCKGNLVRVHEELLAQKQVALSYPALTAFCRRHGI